MRLSSLLLGVSLTAIAVPAAAQTTTTRSGTSTPVRVQTAPPGATPTLAQAGQPTTTLREALVEAYNTNPDLAGERANLRATDENVPIAKSQGRPGVSSTAVRPSNSAVRHRCDLRSRPGRQGTLGARSVGSDIQRRRGAQFGQARPKLASRPGGQSARRRSGHLHPGGDGLYRRDPRRGDRRGSTSRT